MDFDDYNFFEGEEYNSSSDYEEQELQLVNGENGNNFTPRSYQVELFEHARDRNSILVLGTGSGKTFISILLIKELTESTRGKLDEEAKRTVFLVNTVPLVHQQSEVIRRHTGYSVGSYEGSMNIDLWSEEKWKEELNKHEVLVMVAQIFKDLLLHKFISLNQVNLLILDECHHATGNHPMREVMREYNSLKFHGHKVPRVMGLTACVLHVKCQANKVDRYMKKLEQDLDCVLTTSKDQETVLNFTTKPQEIIITCENSTYSDEYYFLINRLNEIKVNILKKVEKCSSILQPKLKEFVSKEICGIIEASEDLGEYILPEAISLQAEYLKGTEAETYQEQEIYNTSGLELENVLLTYNVKHDNILRFLSGKVKRLIEIFKNARRNCNEDEIVALVFVARRNTAKILCSLLLKLKNIFEEISYLKPECVVGGTFKIRNDLKTNEEVMNQKATIENFRKGICNVAVSTSVLEEGIDIRKCNFVIRFNAVSNFSAYLQSLGRARAVPSYFLTLTYADELKEVCESRECYMAIRKYQMTHCLNRDCPDVKIARRNFLKDELEPPFTPYGADGPKITFNSAIQLVYRYCGSLPQDKFTKLSVVSKKYKKNEMYFAELTLPMNSPFRKTIRGKPMNNYEDAKKSAALELCKRLFRHKLLDKNLLPIKSKVDAEDRVKKYLNIPEETINKDLPQPGTKKRRQVYKRGVCLPFKTGDSFYMYKVCFQHLKSVRNELLIDSDQLTTQLGFICGGKLNCPSFPLYSKKWGEVNIIVQFIKQFLSRYELPLEDIKKFHEKTSKIFFHINTNIMSYNHSEAGLYVYIVPLTKSDKIDLTVLNKLNDVEMKAFEEPKNNCLKPLKHFNFEKEKYINGVLVPLYRSPEVFYPSHISWKESPLTEFPEAKKEYSTYKKYFLKRYNAHVGNDDQPLIECRHFSKEFNFFEMTEPSSKKNINWMHPKFIPELCLVIPLSAPFCCQILCMASILHRINGLQLEQEIYESVGYKCTGREKELFISQPLEYRSVKELVQCYMQYNCKNLCLRLQNISSMAIYPGMILQALTPLNVKESFNQERLEILGDSFLKYSVGNYLYSKEVMSHEGTLTIQRSNIVANKTLYTLAKAKGLDECFQGVMLEPATAAPPGFYVKKEIEKKLKEENVNPKDWISYPKRTLGKCEEVYNPWTEQLIPDKNLADGVEALIGVYLLCGGEKAARHFMKWLGFKFIEEKVRFPYTAIAIVSENDINDAEILVESFYKKSRFDKVEKAINYRFKDKSFLISAFTHPSYTNNKVTDCYQRLEFLGDSILDYLITGYLFSKNQSYTPGQLTDLKSHYVKNETLARIAVQFNFHKYMFHMAPKLDNTIQKFIHMLEQGEYDFNTEDDKVEAEDVEVPKALGDLVESLIGAVYQDSNQNLKVTWDVVEILLKKEFEETKTEIPMNNVRALYEKVPLVQFKFAEPTKEGQAKYIVKMPGYKDLIGTGKNKRTAKQAAAKLALNHLKNSEMIF
ncbi:putative aarF domain-containing protein kinase 1 [Armadillidium nasatum]|uniref:Putative aarF domain-containing protein kinase 1 n=1 Tax=Armadillidium nasatum TaxID=96803 RepID=A0A5N5T6N1_9CRUS|nr:putative aarF domain-containing protein kinase 1 [Armadillidium nasatum]